MKAVLRPHERLDYITRCLGASYDPDVKSDLWERFLFRIQPDPEVRSFLARAVGYTLTGSVREHCLFFLYGEGANGKTTFLETIKALMGNYAVKVESSALLSRGRGAPGGATPNLARLKGSRMALVSEIQAGTYLAESLVKDITGGDTIVARELYASLFEFVPTHKLWMMGNHKPNIRGSDLGIWRRIKLIPFKVTIAKKDQDLELQSKLRDELDGVLTWAVTGLQAWVEGGLGEAEQVEQATEAYRAEMDRVGAFIKDCCVLGPNKRTKSQDLYTVYKDWCRSRGFEPLNSRNFGAELKVRRIPGERSGGAIWRQGIALRLGAW